MVNQQRETESTEQQSPAARETSIAPKRSPNHPYIDLQAAISRIRLIHDKYDDHFVPADAIAQLWNMSTTSSSTGKIFAALGQFGLVDDRGRGNEKEYRLTHRALDILSYPETSEQYRSALGAAALSPAIYAEVWNRFNKGGSLPPNDDLIRMYLIRQREDGQFNKSVVDTFIQQFRRSLAFAGVEGSAKMDEVKPANEDSKQTFGKDRVCVGDFVQWTNNNVDQFTEPRQVREIDPSGEWALVEGSNTGVRMSELTVVDPPTVKDTPTGPRKSVTSDPFAGRLTACQDEFSAKPGMAIERATLDEGPAVLQWPDTLSKESFGELEYWIQGVIRRARRKAGLSSDDSNDKAK